MPLTVVHDTFAPADLLRLFDRTEQRWIGHFGEEGALDVGTAVSNPQLPLVYDANNIRDVALPPGMSPAEAVELVREHFAARGTPCHCWGMNASAPESATAPMVQHLLSLGYKKRVADIMRLAHLPAAVAEVGGLTIIPARASFRHARALAEMASAEWGPAAGQLTEAAMLHFDDPHWDAILALDGQTPVATAGVLAVGELGRIDDVFVAETHRRRGIGRTIMSRALEICLRSTFKHVLLCLRPDNMPAARLYEQLGFVGIGQVVTYLAPS